MLQFLEHFKAYTLPLYEQYNFHFVAGEHYVFTVQSALKREMATYALCCPVTTDGGLNKFATSVATT
jgi:hypothetical protein